MSLYASELSHEVTSVRFSRPDWDSCGVKLAGILRLREHGLELEYDEYSSCSSRPRRRGGWKVWVESLRTGELPPPETRMITVPFEDLEYLEGRRFWFWWTAIVVSTERLSLFSAVPGNRQGRLRLLTDWRDRERGRRFVAHANLRLAEWRIQQAEAAGGASNRDGRFKVL
jgi:hypothetical protein